MKILLYEWFADTKATSAAFEYDLSIKIISLWFKKIRSLKVLL